MGDAFRVEAILDNRADSLMDGVDIYIRYDPDILEVVDADRDNWITRGVNILDGPYHQQFPFDYHIENQAFPGKGEIVYRAGIGNAEKLRGRMGVLAAIVFRAKAPAASASVTFRLPESRTDRGTRITYLNQNVLGSPDRPASGLRQTALRILN